MAKPSGELGALVVPKNKAADAAPFQEAKASTEGAPAPGTPAPAIAAASTTTVELQPTKALTVKLDLPLYRRLRDYCPDFEQAGGRRMTHQESAARAISELLDRESARSR